MTDYPIVNALGALDNPNAERSASAAGQLTQSSDQVTIDARTLADAHASGLTAVNITLGYTMGDQPPYEHTLHEIEVWNNLIAQHPDELVKVLRADDILSAKRDRRIGIIYGFQNAVAVGDDLARIDTFAKRACGSSS